MSWLTEFLSSVLPAGYDRQQFYNNLVGRPAALILPSTTTFNVVPQEGTWPTTLAADEWFSLTIADVLGRVEIVRVVAVAGSTLTVERAQEGTSALTWAALGTTLTARLTAASLSQTVRRVEPTIFSAPQHMAEGALVSEELRVDGALTFGPDADPIFDLREDPADAGAVHIDMPSGVRITSPNLRLNGLRTPPDATLVEGQFLRVADGDIVGGQPEWNIGPMSDAPTTLPGGDPLPTGMVYYDTSRGEARVWNGVRWVPLLLPGTGAISGSLIYEADGDPGEVFSLSDADLYGRTYELQEAIPQETVQVHLNGLLLVPDDGSLSVGDYTVDRTANTVTLIGTPPADAKVQIDIMTPVSALENPGGVRTYAHRAAFAAAAPPATVDYVRVLGYTTPFDGGGADFKRVSADPGHFGALQVADGSWWEMADLDAGASVCSFGVELSGAADQSIAMQNAVDTIAVRGGTLYIPGGTLRLDSTISLYSNVNLVFLDTEIDFRGAASNVFEADGSAGRITGVSISGIGLCTFPDAGGWLLRVARCTKVRLRHCSVYRGKLFRSDLRSDFPVRVVGASTIADITAGTIGAGDDAETFMAAEVNYDVIVEDCAAEGEDGVSNLSSANAVVLVRYCWGWAVRRVTISTCRTGVLWWGGDSNPSRDGAIGGKRWCRNGAVDDVTVTGAEAGGIWGSMGELITLSGCRAYWCMDFGLHTEGCRLVTFQGCHAVNCHRSMGSYFFDEQVAYVDCHILIDDPEYFRDRFGGVSVWKQNNGFATDGLSVTWYGGSMIVRNYSVPDHLGLIIGQVGGVIVFRNLLTEGVRISAADNNSGRREFSDVLLRYPADPGGAFVAIETGLNNYSTAHLGLTPTGVGVKLRGIKVERGGWAMHPDSAFWDHSQYQQGESSIEDCDGRDFPSFIRVRSSSGSGTPTIRLGRGNKYSGAIVDDDAGGHGNLRFAGWLRASTTWDPASVAAGGSVSTTVAVPGARFGDAASATLGVNLSGLVLSAHVSANNTVTVVLANPTAGAVDLPSTTLRVRVETEA